MNSFLRPLACCAGLAVLGPAAAFGANLTTVAVEPANQNWNSPAIWQTNIAGVVSGPLLSPVAGNTYALIFNGTGLGNAANNTRVRNPSGASSTFPGDSLTINVNCELREKSGNNGAVMNFPGVNGDPGLILNGGLINAGESQPLPFVIAGTIIVTHQSYLSDAAGGAAGGFQTDTGNRQWNIAGVLGGSANLVLINDEISTPQIISNASNTFSGQWIIQCGWLQGAAAGSLGTNSIVVDPGYIGYTNDLPFATSPGPGATTAQTAFPNLAGAIFEPSYDLNSAGVLTLANGGTMILHQDCIFSAVNIVGVSLALGMHNYSELTANFPGSFAPGGSGSITVQPYGPPPLLGPGINQQPVSVSVKVGNPAQLTAGVSGALPLVYQWQKGTNGVFANLVDTANISGSLSNSLNFVALSLGDAADYRLVVTNALGSATSAVATLTISVPSGFNPQRVGFSHIYPLTYSDWRNALLSGNGEMSIMVFGNPLNDTIIFGDRGFCLAASTNSPRRSFSQVSAANLATIKNDCATGNYSAGDDLAQSAPNAMAGGENNRHPGFEMLINLPANGAISNYSRSCNFETGEVSVNWSDAAGDWMRHSFVSRPDNVVVQYLTAPTGGTLNCSLQLAIDPGMNLPSGMTFSNLASAQFLNLRAHYPANTGGAGYEGVIRVIASGGTMTVSGTVLNVSNANSVLLLSRTAKYYTNADFQWGQQLLQSQLTALPGDYGTLLSNHVAVHQAIFDRVKVNFDAAPADRARANEDLLAMQTNSPSAVKALWERVFDAGRYYFLASSSSNTPPDLYGIWTGDVNDAGFFAYNMDANLNLQIGGGNIGDLPEAMAGYFAINEDWANDFKTNAQKLLGCRGLISSGNTPGTNGLKGSISTFYPYQYATGEVPWLLYPFWEHYLITGDTNFLANTLYPLLRPMGNFYEDFLTLTDTNGNYIFAGSVSPENQPAGLGISLVNNSTFDLSGAKFALSALIQSCNVLGLEQGPGQGVARWSNILNKIPPYLINSDGALQEWSWPGLGDNYNHRHSSHLLTVWPYAEITPENTPELFRAAVITLAKKDAFNYENAGHGWVHSALIAAGLKDARAVNRKILYLLQQGFYFNTLASSHYSSHGAPFCTDTCNTMPDIMMEMLVASSPGVLELLPALPQALDQGAITGVKARNRVTVQSLSWDMNAGTVNCTLLSDIDQSLTLLERSGIDSLTINGGAISSSPLGPEARVIQLSAGVSTAIAITLGQTNLALNQPIIVSSATGGTSGSNAVDGVRGTAWTSAKTSTESIYVDLGSTQNLTGAKLIWGTPYGQAYNLQVSGDAVNWTNAYETSSGLGGADRITLATPARYVRMQGVQSGGGSGYTLEEFEIYARPAIAPSAPLRLNPLSGSDGTIHLTWPAPNAPFIMESATNLTPPVMWTPVTNTVINQNNRNQTTITPVSGNEFFRLKQTQP